MGGGVMMEGEEDDEDEEEAGETDGRAAWSCRFTWASFDIWKSWD